MSVELTARDQRVTPRRHLPLVACCLGTFLLLAYTTVVTVAVAAIGRDLHSGFATDQWVIDVYNLALAALLLGLGHLGDRLGHRRLFLVGVATFGLASLACAAATTGGALVAARAAQGAGGAAVLATSVPLLALGYDGRARTAAFAVWSAVAGAGSTIGTIAGGVVTQYASWRWLFLAAVPLAVAAFVCGALSLPASVRRRTGRPDRAGPIAITAATATLTYAAINAGEHGWLSIGTLAGLAAAIVAGAAFLIIERRAGEPILPVELFATRRFVGVAVCGFAYYFGAFATLPAVSGWLQSRLGLSPVRAAGVLVVQLGTYIVVALAVSARLHRVPVVRTLAGGAVLTGLADLAGLALFAHAGWAALIVPLALSGIGAAIVSPALPVAAAASVPAAHAGTAGAAANAARQLGLTVGIAVCGALAHRDLPGTEGATHALAAAFAVAGAVAVLGGASAARLLRGTAVTPG